jgi:DNA-directed RNA polymerase specialized sigma24 family protein
MGKRITNDAHLAEDIVQDELLRSFLAMAKKHCKKSGRFFVKMVVVIFEKRR